MPTDRYGYSLSTARRKRAMRTSRASTWHCRPITAPRRRSATPLPAMRGLRWPTPPWRGPASQGAAGRAKAAAARARELAPGLPARERSHANALATVVDGGSVAALVAAGSTSRHVRATPWCWRHARGVRPDRVQRLRGSRGRAAGAARYLADAYGDDWWFGSAHAFAQVETGSVDRALATIERSLARYPRNANGAHIRSHVYYESGERAAGLRTCANGGRATTSEASCTATSAGMSPCGRWSWPTPMQLERLSRHLHPGASTGRRSIR